MIWIPCSKNSSDFFSRSSKQIKVTRIKVEKLLLQLFNSVSPGAGFLFLYNSSARRFNLRRPIFMLRGKLKFYSLFGSFALIALFTFTAGQFTAFGQTDDKTDNNIEKSDLIAKKATSDPSKIAAPSFPRLTRKAPPASAVWHRFYAGAYGGASVPRATANTSTVFSSTGYFNVTSPPAIAASGRQNLHSTRFGGGTLGYNSQSGNWVFGAETDFGFLSGTSTATTTAAYPCCNATFTVAQTLKSRWLWTARPRVGYARGNVLYYLTGGLAMTHLNYQAVFTDTFGAQEN